jgi:hypothetical protein
MDLRPATYAISTHATEQPVIPTHHVPVIQALMSDMFPHVF